MSKQVQERIKDWTVETIQVYICNFYHRVTKPKKKKQQKPINQKCLDKDKKKRMDFPQIRKPLSGIWDLFI